MGLGITRATLETDICDNTGDDSDDAKVKVRRLINRKGKQFCNIANWPFLRSDISFTITSATYIYSGANYLPVTFKKVIACYAVDNNEHYPLNEVGIHVKNKWKNPADNTGLPDEFCITRMESGYWEIVFNKLPDQDYTIYFEIALQWTDLSLSSDETIFPKNYQDAFVHYVTMARLQQQGDLEQYSIYKAEWYNPQIPRGTILGDILIDLSRPLKKRSIEVDMSYVFPLKTKETPDYHNKVENYND